MARFKALAVGALQHMHLLVARSLVGALCNLSNDELRLHAVSRGSGAQVGGGAGAAAARPAAPAVACLAVPCCQALRQVPCTAVLACMCVRMRGRLRCRSGSGSGSHSSRSSSSNR